MDGSYSGILETSCDTEAIAAGDTLYTLSDVDLEERDFDVVSMSSDECPTVIIPTPADCYRCVVSGVHVQRGNAFLKFNEATQSAVRSKFSSKLIIARCVW